MNKTCLGLLMLALSACSGATTNKDGTSSSELEKKQAAANDVAAGTAQGDPCAENGWYGDEVCDTFCAGKDTDCVPNGEDPTVCAAFSEVSDGVCSRPEDDACRFQDPDCSQSGGGVPADPGNPDEPVGCALILELSDGVCLRPDIDPCRNQDPDCTSVEPDPGVGCPAIDEAPDGVCSPPEDDPCRYIDPDCGVACAEYIEDSDGVCKRADTDPCRSQDPDCDAVCLTYVEESDGECTRESTDPCRSQDPDCHAPLSSRRHE